MWSVGRGGDAEGMSKRLGSADCGHGMACRGVSRDEVQERTGLGRAGPAYRRGVAQEESKRIWMARAAVGFQASGGMMRLRRASASRRR